MERGAENLIVLDHGVGDIEMRHGIDVIEAEAFHAAAIDIDATNDVRLACKGAALQPGVCQHYF